MSGILERGESGAQEGKEKLRCIRAREERVIPRRNNISVKGMATRANVGGGWC